MEDGIKKYQLDQLIPMVQEFVQHLKEVGESGEIPKDFVEMHPWVTSFPRKENLRKLAESGSLIVNFISHAETHENSAPRQPRIRVSEVNIRHRNDVHSDVFTFQEVEPGEFIYLPK